MNQILKNIKNLSEDEIVNLLYKLPNNFYIEDSLINELISIGFKSVNLDFQLHLIDYLKLNSTRFIKALVDWISVNFKDEFLPTPRIKVNDFSPSKPRNFIEVSLVRLGIQEIESVLNLLSYECYFVYIEALRGTIMILSESKDSILKEEFNKYLDNIIDFCLNHYDEELVKIEISRFLGTINSKESVALLEYFRDNEDDFTLRMVSIMGIDNIQKMNRSKANNGNSEVRKLFQSYRR